MKCRSIICSQLISIDNLSKKAHAFNILDDVQSQIFPFILPLSLLIIFEREHNDHPEMECNFTIGVDDKLLVGPVKLKPVFKDDKKTCKNVISFGAVPIPNPGKVVFCVDISGSKTETWINAEAITSTAKVQEVIPK